MNGDEILQRFAQLDGYALLENTEAVVDQDSARIIFRQTSAAARSRRGCIGTAVVIVGLFEIVVISIALSLFMWLLLPFATVGFLGVVWFQKHQVTDDDKKVDLKIDTRSHTILFPQDIRDRDIRVKHSELNIDEIQDFYAWEQPGSEGSEHSLRCTYGKNEEMIVLRHDVEAIEPVCNFLSNGFYFSNGLYQRFNRAAIRYFRSTLAAKQNTGLCGFAPLDYQRDFVSTQERVSMARSAHGLPQLANRLFTVSPLATRRHMGESAGRVGTARAGAA